MNNYQLLGLDKDAETTDIKRAYFKKVKECSPEKNPEMFMEIRKAYDILLDKDLRAEYDNTLNLPDDERISLSNKFENEGDLKRAIQLMKAVADSYPNSWEAKESLGKLYEREGSFGNAIKVYDGLTKEFPSNQKYAFCLACCLLKRGFNKKADAQFEKTIEINNLNSDIWYKWISMIRVAGHSCKAISLIKRAEAVNENIFKNNYDIYAELWLCRVMEEITSYDLFYKFISFYENGDKFVGDDILFNCLKVILEYQKPLKEYDKEAFEKGMKSAAVNVTEENRHKLNYLELRYYFGVSSASDVVASIHDLTSMKLDLEKSYNKDLENEIVAVKMFMLNKFSKLKGQILKLKQEMPKFYELNKDFYDQIMDAQRRKALERAIRKQVNSIGFDMDGDLSALFDEFNVLEPYVRDEPKVGRNDFCPCGSGKKFKRCCGG